MYINKKESIMLLRKSEYDKLVELAEANEKEIQDRALKMWKEKGIPQLDIRMEIRSLGGRDIIDSGKYKFEAGSYIYNKEGNFCITEKAKERFSNMVREWTHELMERNFGERLMAVNEWNKKVDRLESIRKRFISFTLIGWLMALAMFVSLMLIKLW